MISSLGTMVMNDSEPAMLSDTEDQSSILSSDALTPNIVDEDPAEGKNKAAVTSQNAEASKTELPPLHKAARAGDGAKVSALLTEGSPVDFVAPADGSTALQWAVSSNSLAATTALLAAGANPRKRAGYMNATALHWACRNGNAYMARALLDAGADPTAVDEAGYTPLHTAVHSSNVLLVLYMLYYLDSPPGAPALAPAGSVNVASSASLSSQHFEPQTSVCNVAQAPKPAWTIPSHVLLHQNDVIDARDNAKRTPLHWAAYQGDYLSVKHLLAAGADPDAQDGEGFTALHWALVSRSRESISALLAVGASLWIRTVHGKDAFVVAKEMNAQKELNQALVYNKREEDGSMQRRRLSAKGAWIVAFVWPGIALVAACVVAEAVYRSLHTGLALSLLAALTVLAICSWLSRGIYSAWPGYNALVRSPTLAGVFVGVFIVDICVISTILAPRNIRSVETIALFVTALTSIAFYVRAMCMDPGFVPFGTAASQRQAMEELIQQGKLVASYFDVETGTRRPFRSFYSSVHKRLVARYDHYCPWLANSVGVRNHRCFIVYISLLSVALVLAGRLVWTNKDLVVTMPSIVLLSIITTFQASWIFFLTGVQHLQISRGLTNQEVLDRKESKHPREQYNSLPQDHPCAVAVASPPSDGDATASPHHKRHRNGKWQTFLRILGVEQVSASSALFKSPKSVTNNGTWRNLCDFWSGRGSIISPKGGWGKLNGEYVDYYEIWNVDGDPRASTAVEIKRAGAGRALEQLV